MPEPSALPLARVSEMNQKVLSSPRFPPVTQSTSYPNPPLTWGGRNPYQDNYRPGSMGQFFTYWSYEHQPPAPATVPDTQLSGERHCGQSHSYDWGYDPLSEGQSTHPSHRGSWSHSAPRYKPSPYPDRPPAPPSTLSTSSSSGLNYSWQPLPAKWQSRYHHFGPASQINCMVTGACRDAYKCKKCNR